MGCVACSGARQQPAFPGAGEFAQGRHPRLAQSQYLHAPRRPRAADQHRPDGQCVAVDGDDRRAENVPDPDLLCLQALCALPGRHAGAGPVRCRPLSRSAPLRRGGRPRCAGQALAGRHQYRSQPARSSRHRTWRNGGAGRLRSGADRAKGRFGEQLRFPRNGRAETDRGRGQGRQARSGPAAQIHRRAEGAMIRRLIPLLLLGVSAIAVADEAQDKAAALVARLTLDEKVGQLVNVAPALPRLGIPAYNWWTESLHGAIGAVPTTNFPEPIGLAASFDAPLMQKVAGVISTEVRALHTLGRDTGHLGRIGTGLDSWSPNINIFRDPRWGRGQETYGEDPYLTARLGVSFVTGLQGEDPARPEVIATPKHFAVHSGPESTRHEANVFVSPHDLEDTYLPAFRAAIVEAHAGSVMCAYNRIDGQPACASDLLLKDHLRGDWQFSGYVVSDCDAVKDIADNHHYAADGATAVAAAL